MNQSTVASSSRSFCPQFIQNNSNALLFAITTIAIAAIGMGVLSMLPVGGAAYYSTIGATLLFEGIVIVVGCCRRKSQAPAAENSQALIDPQGSRTPTPSIEDEELPDDQQAQQPLRAPGAFVHHQADSQGSRTPTTSIGDEELPDDPQVSRTPTPSIQEDGDNLDQQVDRTRPGAVSPSESERSTGSSEGEQDRSHSPSNFSMISGSDPTGAQSSFQTLLARDVRVIKWQDHLDQVRPINSLQVRPSFSFLGTLGSIVSDTTSFLQTHLLGSGEIHKRLQNTLIEGLMKSLLGSDLFNAEEFLDWVNRTRAKLMGDAEITQQCGLLLNELEKLAPSTGAKSRFNLYYYLHQIVKSDEYQAYLLSEGSLQDLADCPAEIKTAIELAHTIAYSLFTQVRLHYFKEQALFKIVDRDVVKDSLPKQIQEDVNKIELAPAELVGRGIETTCHKLSGHFNVNFQPLRLNNYSEKLFTVAYESEGVIRHCDFLRFGTPTLELVGKPVELEGAFVLFLNSLKEKGESILSVQLQNRAPKNFLLGDESERVELIIKTASNPRYKDCLKVLALPEDSKFFKQADHEHLTNAEDFKEALLNQVIGEDEDSLFLLPIQDAEKIQVVRDIETLIESVHMRFYNSKKQLEASERHTFQKRLYADLMFYFVAYHQPTFAHAQCKDAMDRAMSLITTFYHQTLMHQREVDLSSRQNELRVLTHGAALLIKGCPMHGERFQTLMHILNQNERIKTEGGDLTAHQWHVKGKSFKLTSIDIDKDPRLLFNKLPSQAASLDEYQERLTEEQYVESSLADLEPLEPEAAKAQLKRDLNNMLFLRDGHMPDCDYSQEAQEAIGHHGSDLGGMANVSAEIKQSIIEARYRNWIDVQTLDREEILGYLGQQLAVPLTDLAMQMYLNIDLNIAVPCLSEGSIAGTVLNVVGSLDASVLEVYQTFVIKNTDTGETIAYLKARAQYSVQTLKGQAQFKVQQDKPTCFELFDGKRTEALHRGTNA